MFRFNLIFLLTSTFYLHIVTLSRVIVIESSTLSNMSHIALKIVEFLVVTSYMYYVVIENVCQMCPLQRHLELGSSVSISRFLIEWLVPEPTRQGKHVEF